MEMATVELQKQVNGIELQAEMMTVSDDAGYKAAGEFGRLIKQRTSDITGFFKPLKDAAFKSHREICDKEKSMLDPLKNAEKLLKKSMGDYAAEVERKRREEEARIKAEAEAEAQRALAEALKLESEGDVGGAAAVMQNAEMVESYSQNAAVTAEKPKANGISSGIDWEITNVDDKTVPIDMSGIALRPVDTAAVMRIIRASKGTISIPGISYRQIQKIGFRR